MSQYHVWKLHPKFGYVCTQCDLWASLTATILCDRRIG